jgi:hypothetical protein
MRVNHKNRVALAAEGEITSDDEDAPSRRVTADSRHFSQEELNDLVCKQVRIRKKQKKESQAAYQAHINKNYYVQVMAITGGPCTETVALRGIRKAADMGKAEYYQVQQRPTVMFADHLDALSFDPTDKAFQPTERRPLGAVDGRQVVLAIWPEYWELTQVLQEHSNWPTLIATYQEKQQEIAERQAAANGNPDAHLTDQQKQGCWMSEGESHAAATTGVTNALTRQRVHIQWESCDPDRDLADPPGVWLIQAGTRHDSNPLNPVMRADLVHVYSPAGRWMGCVSQPRMCKLRAAWLAVHPAQREDDDVERTFARDLGALLLRHDPKRVLSVALLGQEANARTESVILQALIEPLRRNHTVGMFPQGLNAIRAIHAANA